MSAYQTPSTKSQEKSEIEDMGIKQLDKRLEEKRRTRTFGDSATVTVSNQSSNTDSLTAVVKAFKFEHDDKSML